MNIIIAYDIYFALFSFYDTLSSMSRYLCNSNRLTNINMSRDNVSKILFTQQSFQSVSHTNEDSTHYPLQQSLSILQSHGLVAVALPLKPCLSLSQPEPQSMQCLRLPIALKLCNYQR